MDLDIDSMAIQVKDRYPEKNIQDIKIDLQLTNNIQTTLNRIKNGQVMIIIIITAIIIVTIKIKWSCVKLFLYIYI